MKKSKKSNSTKTNKTNNSILKNWTKKDLQRWATYMSVVAILLAVIVSLMASILWSIGLLLLIFAFSDKLKSKVTK